MVPAQGTGKAGVTLGYFQSVPGGTGPSPGCVREPRPWVCDSQGVAWPCRIAQKQCCVSAVRENSCLAGMIAAKEGDTCGPEDSDPCAGSSYKVSSSAGV